MTRAAAAWRELPAHRQDFVIEAIRQEMDSWWKCDELGAIAIAVLREAARPPVSHYHVRQGTVRGAGIYLCEDEWHGKCARWGGDGVPITYQPHQREEALDDAGKWGGRVVAVRRKR